MIYRGRLEMSFVSGKIVGVGKVKNMAWEFLR